MSRVLSELLGAPEPAFTSSLRQLEAQSGHGDIDVRLASEIAQTLRSKMKALGLDPNDTNGSELYHALQSLIAKHDEFLAKAIGGKDPQDAADLLPRIVAHVKSLPTPKNCWALKHSVAKRLVKDMPPKKLMKHLGYRSVDSLLKREEVDEIYAGIQLVESPSWRNKFIATYRKLSPSDFETRRINVKLLEGKRWQEPAKDFVYSTGQNLIMLKELGAVVVLPLPVDKLRGVTITVLPLLLSSINELHIYSTYFKLEQVKPNFGQILVSTLMSNDTASYKLAGKPLHWRVIYRHYGTHPQKSLPEAFDPHVQAEDLGWQTAEEILYKLEPALKFWEDGSWVGSLHDGRPVPLSLLDNATSYCNNLAYGGHSVGHFRQNLQDEIYNRYLGQQPVEDQIIKQLETASAEAGLIVANFMDGF